MNTPDWLTKRGGSLKQGSDGRSWFVWMGSQPDYRLVPTPVGESFGCAVTQTINGQRLPTEKVADTPEAALATGLEAMRVYLGW